MRCKYVATEVNHGDTKADVYAATPSPERIRLLLSKWSQRKPKECPGLCLMFLDVTHAQVIVKPKNCTYFSGY